MMYSESTIEFRDFVQVYLTCAYRFHYYLLSKINEVLIKETSIATVFLYFLQFKATNVNNSYCIRKLKFKCANK